MSGSVLLNGQVIDNRDAVISVFDHGFLYGMGLFETFRTYGGGRPWLLERHAVRLAEGCRALGIDYAVDVGRMREGVAALLAANQLADGYIRWSVSAGGAGEVGLPQGPYEAPQEIVYAKALAPDDPGSRPGKLLRLLQLRRSSTEGGTNTPRLKSFHYMNNILAKRELSAAGAGPGVEGLFLNGSGHVCEGTVSNVFWLSNGALYTPSTGTGALPGITRGCVLEMAAEAGIAVREGGYDFDKLTQADEIFLTNSVQEVVPVTALADEQGAVLREFPGAGTITRAWMQQYRSYAERGEHG